MAKHLSLRGRFALWTSVVVIASVTVLMLSVYLVSSRLLTAQADEEMNRIVSKTAEQLDLWLDSRERDAINLSEMQPFVAACTEHQFADAQPALIRIHQRSPFYENVFLTDANGKEILDSIGGKSVGFDLMSVEGFHANVQQARQGAVWMGEVMKSPATGRPVVLVTAPVRAGTQVVGILGTPIELTNFSDNFISKYRIRKTGYLYLLDGSGILLAHPDPSKIMWADNAKLDFVQKIVARGNGSLAYEFEGVPKVSNFQRAQKKPWTVVAVVPAAELFASVRTVQTYLLLFGILTLGATVLAVSFLAGRTAGVLRGMVDELTGAVRQLFAASSQISSSSQSLSQGASRQAASIEETSASAAEINSITRQNNERSQRVAVLMNEAIPIVDALSRSHQELDMALTATSASSEKVAKVIKMIDEIAFQTNILALNAAVEAARAGEAGMGFAVVADEVRNLAHRSADAAKDTSVLIEEALAKSRDGRQKVDAVNVKMDANNRITAAVKSLTDEIGAASTTQARGIEQINTAIGQMSHVVQSTAAQAEENAAASEQLNAQSQMLQEIVARLSRLISGHDRGGVD